MVVGRDDRQMALRPRRIREQRHLLGLLPAHEARARLHLLELDPGHGRPPFFRSCGPMLPRIDPADARRVPAVPAVVPSDRD
jgi:hypothetical protein